jgi:hypothetical protein
VSLQHRVDRAPVDAGALHRHQRAARGCQPVPHLFQVRAGRAEGADLLAGSLGGRTTVQAGQHCRLMNVQPGAAFNDCFHAPLLVLRGCNRLRRAIKSDSTMRAPRCRGRQRAIPLRRRGSDSATGIQYHRITPRPRSDHTFRVSWFGPRRHPLEGTTQAHLLPSRCGRRPLVDSALKADVEPALAAVVSPGSSRPSGSTGRIRGSSMPGSFRQSVMMASLLLAPGIARFLPDIAHQGRAILVPRVADSAVISRRVRDSGRDVWSSLNPAISTTRGTRRDQAFSFGRPPGRFGSPTRR